MSSELDIFQILFIERGIADGPDLDRSCSAEHSLWLVTVLQRCAPQASVWKLWFLLTSMFVRVRARALLFLQSYRSAAIEVARKCPCSDQALLEAHHEASRHARALFQVLDNLPLEARDISAETITSIWLSFPTGWGLQTWHSLLCDRMR